MVFVTPVVEHWLEQEIAQWVNQCYRATSHSQRYCEDMSIILAISELKQGMKSHIKIY